MSMNDETHEPMSDSPARGGIAPPPQEPPPGSTQAPPTSPGPGSPRVAEAGGIDGFFAWLRRLDVRRDTDNKWIGGVCSGLAERLGVDPIVVRVLAVVLAFFAGIGVAAYLTAWVLIPNRSEEIVAERGVRGGEVGPLLLSVLAVLAVAGLVLRGPREWVGGWGWAPFWLAVIAITLVVWLVARNRSGTTWQSPAWPSPPGPAAPGPAEPAPPGPAAGPQGSGVPDPSSAAPDTPSGLPSDTRGITSMTAATPPQGSAPAYEPPPPGQSPPPGPVQPAYGPPPPPAPQRPRVPRAGFLAAVVTGGLALVVYGLMTLLHDRLGWPGDGHAVALAGALTVFGLATLTFGIIGLRAGLTAVVSVVLALVTWGTAAAPTINVAGGVGDRYWAPVAASSHTYELGVGNATLDLGTYPTEATPGQTIRVSIGAGDLRILVPADLTVRVDGTVTAGTVTVDGVDLGQTDSRSGPRVEVHETYGPAPTDVIVRASVGAGQIQIDKE